MGVNLATRRAPASLGTMLMTTIGSSATSPTTTRSKTLMDHNHSATGLIGPRLRRTYPREGNNNNQVDSIKHQLLTQ